MDDFLLLRNEVMRHDPKNAKKKELIIATKCDMLHLDPLYHLDSLHYRLKAKWPDIQVVGTSARFGLGLARVATTIRRLLHPDQLVNVHRVKAQPLADILLPNADEMKRPEARLPANLPAVPVPAHTGASVFPLPALRRPLNLGRSNNRRLLHPREPPGAVE
eukprot:GHVT01101415.1.p2 GENE.GHVT01101415.1~~GHVT01101415.1.p2  ORF type:complete len:162 (+),score=31.44 GHVT01101415.1:1281-1766(+)